MSHRSYAQVEVLSWLALALTAVACGDSAEGGALDAQAQGAVGASDAALPSPIDGAAASTTTGFDAGALPGNPSIADATVSGPVLVGSDASAAQGDSGTIVITIPTRSVTCGASQCTTTNNRTCCDAWNKGTGFVGKPTCTTNAACTGEHPSFGDTNRAVLSDCDEPADCGGGQICCFVRYGAPVTAELFSADIVGPGASRLCMDLSNCNAGMMSISGVAGIPIGVTACKTDADCTDGARCTPEQADSSTTGKGGSARPGVMSCR